jgi:drug/metabolite transporter (DMT)-like permease
VTATVTTDAAVNAAERRHRLIGFGAVAAACLVLSFGSTLVKKVGSPGAVTAFWRLLLGSGLWLAIGAATGKRLTRRALRLSLPMGVLFGLNICLFFTGARLTRISHAEFIGMLAPLIVLPVANRRFKERVDLTTVGCAALALGGVALVLTRAQPGATHWGGNLLIVGSVITWSSYLLMSKQIRQELDTVTFMTGMTIAATATAFPVALSTGKTFDVSAKGWLLIAAMAVTSGMVAHGLLIWSQSRVPVSTTSLMQISQPPLATLWAFVFVGEAIRAVQAVGMALVLLAVGTIVATTSRSSAGN